MTRPWTISIALSLGAFGLAGCPEEETPEDMLIADIDEYAAQRNDQVDVLCDCYEMWSYGSNAVTFDSKDECKSGLGEILPSRRRCIDDAFQQDVAASQQWMDCVLPLEQELATCYNDKATCDDTGSITPCIEDYDIGVDNCISLPNSVDRDLEACF